ncbi:MAG: methylated-DNA--[protein]-cysteine S-methyltransferase [Planctomycetaceae bacterium]
MSLALAQQQKGRSPIMAIAAISRRQRDFSSILETDRPDFANRYFTLFRTSLGWIGFRGDGIMLSRVSLGHLQREQAERDLRQVDAHEPTPIAADGFPELRDQFERFAAGEYVEFTGYKLIWPRLTSFQKQVMQATFALRYGATSSYREIAIRVGSPRAARAVGNALGANLFPLLIPCHRVLASGGLIGGFTAPQGIPLKKRLLEMEQAQLGR